jgi:hypothetical protein
LFAQIWENPRWPPNFVQKVVSRHFQEHFIMDRYQILQFHFMDVKYSPSSILAEFGQNPRWLPGIKHLHIVQKMFSK